MTDTRVVYGAMCTYWGGIETVGSKPMAGGRSIPCCPHCGGMLFEMPHRDQYIASVENYAATSVQPDYADMVKWAEGKCFRKLADMRLAYEADKRQQECIDSLPVIKSSDFL